MWVIISVGMRDDIQGTSVISVTEEEHQVKQQENPSQLKPKPPNQPCHHAISINLFDFIMLIFEPFTFLRIISDAVFLLGV